MLKITENSQKTVVELDKYSRIILTVIAICLMMITVNLYFSPEAVNAYDTVQDVNLKSVNGYSISGSFVPIDIQRIEGSSGNPLEIDIKSINGRNVFGDKVPVDIQSINGQFFIGSDLPVKVK